MDYKAILNQLAEKENLSASEIENEMQNALKCSGMNCSAEEFIKITASIIKKRLYIVK